jgi:hypothetical protein
MSDAYFTFAFSGLCIIVILLVILIERTGRGSNDIREQNDDKTSADRQID